MKLKDKKNGTYSLTEPGWTEEAVEQFYDKITIVQDIPKGRGSVTIGFRVIDDVPVLAEKMIYKKVGFSSISEVYRAAIHMGISLLWHYTEIHGKKNPDDSSYIKGLQKIESFVNANRLIKNFLNDIRIVQESFEFGIITADERDNTTEEMIELLPAKIQRMAREKLKRYLAGDKISELTDIRSHGGDRKSTKS